MNFSRAFMLKTTTALGLLAAVAVGGYVPKYEASTPQQRVYVEDFEDKTSEAEQEQSQWCWAASIQAVLAYYGIKREQRDIVRATYGTVVNLPARSPQQLYSVLNNFMLSDDDKIEIVRSNWGVGSLLTAQVLYRELEQDHPIIVWFRNGPMSGHSVVIYEAHFDSYGRPITVKIFDPWPGQGFKTIPAQPFGSEIEAFFTVRGARVGNGISTTRRDSSRQASETGGVSEEEYQRRFEECMDGMPEQCVRTCMRAFGNPESLCRSRLCLPTPTNLSGWRSKCRRVAREG
jgi:Peptidase_C39 like family